jgi:hypothetical protein
MDWTQLLCVHVDGSLIYQIQYNYNCYIKNHVSIIEKDPGIFKIYTTIVNDILYIETDKNIEDYNYSIINVQGQIMRNESLISNVISVSNFTKGFYFIIISDNNKNKYIKTHKIVKH